MSERIRKDEIDREKIVAAFDNHSDVISDLKRQLLRSCEQRDSLERQLADLRCERERLSREMVAEAIAEWYQDAEADHPICEDHRQKLCDAILALLDPPAR